jgi:hypothetical protein
MAGCQVSKKKKTRLKVDGDRFHRSAIASHRLGIFPAPLLAQPREIHRGLPFVPGGAR